MCCLLLLAKKELEDSIRKIWKRCPTIKLLVKVCLISTLMLWNGLKLKSDGCLTTSMYSVLVFEDLSFVLTFDSMNDLKEKTLNE